MKTNRYQMILKPVMVLFIDVLFSVLVIIGFASSMNAIVPVIVFINNKKRGGVVDVN